MVELKKRRRRSRSPVAKCLNSAGEGASGNRQTLVLVLICIVILTYTGGFMACLSSLPDVQPDILSLVHFGNLESFHNSKQSETRPIEEKDLLVPKSVWPVKNTSEEKDTWVTIEHPGNPAFTMDVPPFWSKPIHNNKLMTRKQAMQIGTCTEPDTNGNFQRGDACPLDKRTIFVAIASYRDWQCKHTVESIFSRAKHPDRVRVAIIDQIVDGDDVCNEPIHETCDTMPEQALCKYSSRIDEFIVDAPLSVGPVFARHLGHRQYRGEYYSMQSDAHVTFTQNWDEDIIQQHEATRDELAVLTTYLTDIVGSIDEKTGASLRDTRPIMCNTDYEGGYVCIL